MHSILLFEGIKLIMFFVENVSTFSLIIDLFYKLFILMQVFIETGYYSPVTGINNTPLGSSNYCLIRLISGLETRLQILHKLTFTLVDYRNYKYFRFSNPF